METVIVFFLCAVIAVVAIITCAYVLTKYILLPYRHKSTVIPPDQLFKFLQLVVENEIKLFDERTYGNGKKAGLSHSDYENYFTYLTTTILDGLSDEFRYKMSFFMSEKHLAEVVTSIVHEYLKGKIE